MPRFSIILPTRDRPELLEHSVIPSIMNQTFGDYELVICDNASGPKVKDAVERVRLSHPDKNIRFERIEKWIPKEKFFQWSLEKSEGLYTTLFFDDDVFCSRALEKINILTQQLDNPDAITYSRALCYFYKDYPVADMANKLVIPSFTGSVERYSAREHLEQIFKRNEIFLPTPMVSNGFYKTRLIKEAISQFGDLYPHGHMGDYNTACHILSRLEKFYYLDDPIAIFGHWSLNTSAQLHDLETTMQEYVEWISEFSENYLMRMPFKKYIWPNCVAAALNDMSQRLSLGLNVDKNSYFRSIYDEIIRLERNPQKANLISNYRGNLEEVAKLTLGDQSSYVLNIMTLLPAHGKSGNGKLLKISIANHRYDKMHRRGYEVPGGDQFNSILSALRYYEAISGETAHNFINSMGLNGRNKKSKRRGIKKLTEKILNFFKN